MCMLEQCPFSFDHTTVVIPGLDPGISGDPKMAGSSPAMTE